jgi:hypothetical protein
MESLSSKCIEDIQTALFNSKSKREAFRLLEVRDNHFNRKMLNDIIEFNNLDMSSITANGVRWNDKEFIRNMVSKAENISAFLESLGLTKHSSNFKIASKFIEKYNIDTSHFKNRPKSNSTRSIPIVEILNGKHPNYKGYELKKRLFKEEIKKEQCEKCGITEWLGEPIVLELDHINGDSSDHNLNNLRIYCPNCHSQTPTWKNRKLLKHLSG